MAFNPTAQNVNGYSSTATYINKYSLNRTNPYANTEGVNAEHIVTGKQIGRAHV